MVLENFFCVMFHLISLTFEYFILCIGPSQQRGPSQRTNNQGYRNGHVPQGHHGQRPNRAAPGPPRGGGRGGGGW